jgi:hypothetical protein
MNTPLHLLPSCVFLRPMNYFNPDWDKKEYVVASKAGMLTSPRDGYLKRDENGKLVPVYRQLTRPAGYVHSAHDAHLLCEDGEALPHNDLCKEICEAKGLTEAEIRRRHAQKIKFENTLFDVETGEPIPEGEIQNYQILDEQLDT